MNVAPHCRRFADDVDHDPGAPGLALEAIALAGCLVAWALEYGHDLPGEGRAAVVVAECVLTGIVARLDVAP